MRHSTLSVVSMAAPGRGVKRVCVVLVSIAMLVTGQTFRSAPRAVADPPAPMATISGTVVDSTTDAALANVRITDASAGSLTTTTDATGHYALTVAPGDHVLTAALHGYVADTSPLATLADGQTTDLNFSLVQYASASGVVTAGGTSTGIGSVVVSFFDAATSDPNPLITASTSSDGQWAVDRLLPGTYKVQFNASETGYASSWYDGKATRTEASGVRIGAGSATNLSASLVLAETMAGTVKAADAGVVALSPAASLSGTVTGGTNGTPLANSDVSALTPDGIQVGSATTASDGTYEIGNLAEGNYVIVANSPPGDSFATSYYGGVAVQSLATYVAVAANASVSGLNIHLGPTGSLSGSVKRAGGTPAAAASLTLVDYGFTRTTTPDASGSFTFGAIPPGSYELSATEGGSTIWWDGARSRTTASTITVNGNDVSGLTLTLPGGYTLSGVLHDGDGQSVPGATMYLLGSDGQQVQTTTDGTGAYAFRGLRADSYKVAVTVGYRTIWLPGASNPSLAQTFDVAGDRTLDVTIPTPTSLVVNASTATGDPVPDGAYVIADDADGAWVDTASTLNGSATLSLYPGTYTIHVASDGLLGVDVQVTVPSQSTVDITVPNGGTISGALAQAPGYRVLARNVATGASFEGAVTNSAYTVSGLPTGDYVLTALPYNIDRNCGPAVWYGGAGFFDATRIHVADGASSTIDLLVSCTLTQDPYSLSGSLSLPTGFTLTDVTTSQVGISAENVGTGDIQGTHPAIDGTFSFTNLAPGAYLVTVNSWSLGLGVASALITIDTADVTNVAITVPKAGSITGRVVDAFGHVPSAMSVWAEGANGARGSGNTDASGDFSLIGLSADEYEVHVLPPAPYSPVTLTSVKVWDGQETALPTVTLQTGGRVAGVIPSGTGSVTIDAVDAGGNILVSTGTYGGGDYTLPNVPHGDVYLKFSGDKIVTEWWKDAASQGAATPVTVSAGQAVRDIDPILTTGGGAPTTSVTIAGTITGPNGPVAGVTVTAEAADGIPSDTVTNSDGSYTLSVPRSGTYTVAYAKCLGYEDYAVGCLSDYYSGDRTVVVGTDPVTGVDFVIVPGSAFTLSPRPTISGSAVAGQTLSASLGGWDPAPDTTTWQWYADGQRIVGATSSSLALKAAHVGKQIIVWATGEKTGYVVTSRVSLATAVVASEPVMTPGSVSISGTAGVGSTLTAVLGTWAPAAAVITYAWWRDGSAIPGATAATYVPVIADTGHKLAVAVTGTLAGWVPATVVSDATAQLPQPSVQAGEVSITGTPTVSSTLTAGTTNWSPVGLSLTLAYQWRRDSTPIGGATGASYQPTTGDVGHTLTVAVTGSKEGYAPATAISAATAAIQSGVSKLAYEAFVKASYKDFLGRLPSADEVALQATALSQGRVSKADYLKSLSRSDEWLTAIVTKMYRDTLHRDPDAAGLADWVSWLRSGRFTVAEVASRFYSSNEYYSLHAGNTTSSWVTLLYQKLLNRDPDPEGLQFWINLTNNPRYGRDWVASNFYQSEETRIRRVEAMYQALLSREPDQVGWPFWTARVLWTGDLTLAWEIANSDEYWEKAHSRY